MYLVRTEATVVPGGAAEFEAMARELGELRKKTSPGSGQTLLRSYGRPSTYTIVGRYESFQAARDFTTGEAFTKFAKSAPTGLFTSSRPQEGYFGVLEVNASLPRESVNCEIWVDWQIELSKAVAFEESRKQLFELMKQHQEGYASARLRRHAGSPTRYLVIRMYTDYEAAMAAPAQEIVAFARAKPADAFGSIQPTTDTHHVLHRI